MRQTSWSLLRVGALLLSGTSALVAAAQSGPPDEGQVRAAIIANITKFVTWPQSGSPGPNLPFILGLAGYDDQSRALEKFLVAHPPANRTIVVKQLSRTDTGTDCHLIYVASSERRRFAELASQTARYPVLTVSDDEHFVTAGGMVGLPLEGDHIEIQINLSRSQRSGLVISSRLLGLAKIVREEGVK